jgi:hypothetical protein
MERRELGMDNECLSGDPNSGNNMNQSIKSNVYLKLVQMHFYEYVPFIARLILSQIGLLILGG